MRRVAGRGRFLDGRRYGVFQDAVTRQKIPGAIPIRRQVEEGAGLTLKLPSSKNQCSNHLLSFHICAIIFAMRVLLTGVVLFAAAYLPAVADSQP